MAGIVGIIGSAASPNVGLLENMLAAMNYNSDDERRSYRDQSLGCSLGWIARSKSFAAGGVFWDEAKDIGIIFSGELFPDLNELQELRFAGHNFESGNASYLPHLYEESGPSFFKKLNGRFSGCVLDRSHNQVTLFNDRYGSKRIYFTETKDGFFFASEAKALLRVLPETKMLDERGVAEFVSCGCVLQNRTIFNNISVLPGAARWTITPEGTVQKHVYFASSEWEQQSILTEEAYYDELKATFSRVLPRYLNGSQPLGMSLTGGLDGRMIMAWAKPEPGKLPCYTFGGSYRECVDVTLAREIARTCAQSHSVISVKQDFLDSFPRLANETIRESDGTLDVTGTVETYVNSKAREIAPVRVTGSYGSEILRGNVAFKPQLLNPELFSDCTQKLAEEAQDTYQREIAMPEPSFIAFKQVPWHHYGRLAVEESKVIIRTPFLDNALVALAYQAPPRLRRNPEPCLRLVAEGNPSLARIPTDRGLSYPPRLTAKLGSYLEQLRFKAEYVYDYGMPQWLARIDHRLNCLGLDRLFLGWHKFYHFRVWYRDQLAPYLREVFLDPRSQGRNYVSKSGLNRIVEGHLERGLNYTTEITQLLSLELIQRELLETN